MASQVVSRRSFFKLFGAAAVVAPVAPKYFFAPIGGWSPFSMPSNGLFPAGRYKIESGEALFFLPKEYSASITIDPVTADKLIQWHDEYRKTIEYRFSEGLYGYKG
jgi:hypothetical protein